jgi:hypothetical protein
MLVLTSFLGLADHRLADHAIDQKLKRLGHSSTSPIERQAAPLTFDRVNHEAVRRSPRLRATTKQAWNNTDIDGSWLSVMRNAQGDDGALQTILIAEVMIVRRRGYPPVDRNRAPVRLDRGHRAGFERSVNILADPAIQGIRSSKLFMQSGHGPSLNRTALSLKNFE